MAERSGGEILGGFTWDRLANSSNGEWKWGVVMPKPEVGGAHTLMLILIKA